ncbi:MAG: hypothetical protein B7Y85_11640, partial [Brevundimonas sp. 32-68-21]
MPVSFALLLNLVAVANPEDRSQLWGFISRYAPEASPETHPLLDELAGYAMSYYRDFILPAKTYRAPTEQERAAMVDLSAQLKTLRGLLRNFALHLSNPRLRVLFALAFLLMGG